MADVVLLAEVFNKYRESCMKQFGLDPARFVTVQSMTMTNWLKYSKITVGTINNTITDIHYFIYNAIRGGICSVGEITYVNVYNKPGETIVGFDMNALYPTAMMYPLPCGEFQWVYPEEAEKAITEYDLTTSQYGYYIECDIHVPPEIHDMVSAYPLFPEKLDDKLKCTLYDKKNYIVHIAYLQLGLQLGYQVTKIHRAVKFRQDYMMNSYIIMLAEERKKYPKGTFMNELYKKMANSLFGKTCENPKNYCDNRIAVGDKDVRRMLNNNRIKNFHKVDDDYIIIANLEMDKVYYNKPIAIGATILDLSKMYMQNFYYNILKPYYGDNMKFLYTDTDSLVVWLGTNNLKEDIKNMQECFESDSTKGLPGVMKIEKDNIQEFHALCPKQYYYIPYDPIKKMYSLVNKFKGIPEYARDIPFKSQEEIIEHLRKGKPLTPKTTYNLTSIKSKNHQIMVVDHQKEVSGKDDKRYYIDDIHTLALGHYKIGNL
jgi:hypothetical protein